MLKVMTDEETKKYHLKKLYKLSLKSIGEKPQLEKPTYDQKEWVIQKMKAPESAWNTSIEHRPWIFRWCYFVLGDYE